MVTEGPGTQSRLAGARPPAYSGARAGRALPGVGAAVAIAAGTALLFLAYLRVSWTVAATSDGAAQALQARDMLTGNWLPHGWTLSDVSFYPTELPEYVLVEVIRSFGVGVIHVAAAATYTLLVLAACWLARGRAAGREGLLRSALAAVIMAAPQLGYGAFVLLLSPDHVGTQLPLLIGWLLLDLAPRRWWVPALLCLLLAWVQLADRVAVLTAVLPLAAVCAVLVGRGLARRRGRECWFELALIAAGIASVGLSLAAARLLAAAGGFAGHPFELTLAPLSLLWTHARLTGWSILALFGANFVGVAGWVGRAFAALHLVGLALATAAVAVALYRFARPAPIAAGRSDLRAGVGLVDSVLAVAIVANLLSYLLSNAPGTTLGTGYEAREIAAVLPLGAVLAGRIFGAAFAARASSSHQSHALSLYRLRTHKADITDVNPCRTYTKCAGGASDGAGDGAAGWGGMAGAGGGADEALAGVAGAEGGGDGAGLGVRRRVDQFGGGAKTRDRSISAWLLFAVGYLVVAGYGSALGYSAAQASRPGQYSALADWLAAHGLRYGLGDGASANVVTVDSGGRVTVEPTVVRMGHVEGLLYQSSAAAFEGLGHDANFLVTQTPAIGPGYPAETTAPYPAVLATFGRPARTYRFDGYAVWVWNVNLLTRLAN